MANPKYKLVIVHDDIHNSAGECQETGLALFDTKELVTEVKNKLVSLFPNKSFYYFEQYYLPINPSVDDLVALIKNG